MSQPDEGVTEQAAGPWVLYTDYLALKAALREALDGWAFLEGFVSDPTKMKRILELRKFLDDK